MNDTDMINEKLAEMKRKQAAQREEERSRPRRTVADMIRDANVQDAAKGVVKPMEKKDVAAVKVEVKEEEAPRIGRTPKSGKGSRGYDPEKKKTSQYRGVSYQKATSQWVASLYVGGNTFAEYASSEESAAVMYDKMAVRWLRSRAKTNFPIEEYEMPELPPVVSGDGIVTSEHIRAACHRYILMRGLISNKKMDNWTMVNNLFFWENTTVSQEWVMEWCQKLGIDPMGYDL